MRGELIHIGKQYIENSKRIKKLIQKKEKELITESDNSILENDLKILRAMERDCREMGRECLHYYEGGWWRSEHYTLNARKSRNYFYSTSHDELWGNEPEWYYEDERGVKWSYWR